MTELEAIAATVSGKENVAGDAAVIQSKARELELLVPKLMARQATRSDAALDPQSAPPTPRCSTSCDLLGVPTHHTGIMCSRTVNTSSAQCCKQPPPLEHETMSEDVASTAILQHAQ